MLNERGAPAVKRPVRAYCRGKVSCGFSVVMGLTLRLRPRPATRSAQLTRTAAYGRSEGR
ncbi:hypothetical protein Kpho01_71620 [Kitasatospora phosalacinea]|uniref:Uncharacterized protein n=1 Tax=Kitasatospora phosalacinea TaxID=2065 RepID=A0A9W6PQU7_9ACTN|nr:hypothetical protein Kpho01_71620 [Kitasatospora phosalacinea]